MRYRLPPLAADTKMPIRPTAAGASNSTGAWQVAILRAPRRASAARRRIRPGPRAPRHCAATRAELYQSSRCIGRAPRRSPSSDSAWREVGKPGIKPRLLASMNCECWAETVAPSEFADLRTTARSAARSVRRARRIASSVPQVPGMKEVQIELDNRRAREFLGLGRTGAVVHRRLARDRDRGLHRARAAPPRRNRRCWRGRAAPSAGRRNKP